ncbi:hypothetical protein ACH4T9_31310 [Micromonospora sp. NPDC020750]|uniref:hypothetical protein n=1 Tax=unclassified Micromonospora TaxID=2617518 RepID=UPI0037AC8C03
MTINAARTAGIWAPEPTRPVPTTADRLAEAARNTSPTRALDLEAERDDLRIQLHREQAETCNMVRDRDEVIRERDQARETAEYRYGLLVTAAAERDEARGTITAAWAALNAAGLQSPTDSVADLIARLAAQRDHARAALEQAQRQALTEASDLLWAWAEETGDVGGTGLRAARKRTIKACARKIAPEPTDDEMRAALAELLAGMADRAKAAALPSPGSAQDRAQGGQPAGYDVVVTRLHTDGLGALRPGDVVVSAVVDATTAAEALTQTLRLVAPDRELELPAWVLDLVQGLADYEDEHPPLYRRMGESQYGRWVCPGALLDLVPSHVRAQIAAEAAQHQAAVPADRCPANQPANVAREG